MVVGISGASGVIYGVRMLDALRDLGVESHLVVSRAALLTLSQETDLSADDLSARASVTHRLADVGAAIASGSFKTMGMVIAPCSVRTMGEIATGVTSIPAILPRGSLARGTMAVVNPSLAASRSRSCWASWNPIDASARASSGSAARMRS